MDQNDTRVPISEGFSRANLKDVRMANKVIDFGKSEHYSIPETVAAAIRFGYLIGKRENKEKIRELHERVHKRQIVDEDSAWMDDPDELLTASAVMAGRAVALKAGNAPLLHGNPSGSRKGG